MPSGWPPKELRLPSKEVLSAVRMHLLVVHKDEPLWLCETLHSFGFSVQVFRQGEDALDCIAQTKGVAGVLLDAYARTPDDRPLLSELRERYPHIPIITMADYRDIDLLRASIKMGAHEYLVTPIHDDVLKIKCAKVFFHRRRADSSPLDEPGSDRDHPGDLPAGFQP